MAIETIIQETYKRDKSRKQFWLNVVDSQLYVMRSDLRNLYSYYEVILKESPNEERLDGIEELIALDKYRASKQTAPTLTMAMSQIAGLLDDNSITRDADPSAFTWLLETANIRQSAKLVETAMAMIEVRLDEIDTLRERLKKEMTAI